MRGTGAVNKVMADRAASGGDVQAIAAGLQEDLAKLTRGSTTTGEPHDRLRMFPMAFMPAVEEAAETGSSEAVSKVRVLLDVYPR